MKIWVSEVNYGKHFDTQVEDLVSKYNITREAAGCFLLNFEDDYMCHKFNGGCDNLEKCKLMDKKEIFNETMDR